MAEWHYSKGDAQLGPVSAAALKSMANSGELSTGDLVWKEGMAGWTPAGDIKGLIPPPAGEPAKRPLAKLPATGGVPENRPTGAMAVNKAGGAAPGFIERLKGKLPVYRYQVERRIKTPNVTEKAVADAVYERLKGFGVTRGRDGSMIVERIDRHLNLGVVDQWLTWNWVCRDVAARFTVRTVGDRPTITAEIRQRWSNYFVWLCILAIPTLCVGVAALGFAFVCAQLAKTPIAKATQKLLDEVAEAV